MIHLVTFKKTYSGLKIVPDMVKIGFVTGEFKSGYDKATILNPVVMLSLQDNKIIDWNCCKIVEFDRIYDVIDITWEHNGLCSIYLSEDICASFHGEINRAQQQFMLSQCKAQGELPIVNRFIVYLQYVPLNGGFSEPLHIMTFENDYPDIPDEYYRLDKLGYKIEDSGFILREMLNLKAPIKPEINYLLDTLSGKYCSTLRNMVNIGNFIDHCQILNFSAFDIVQGMDFPRDEYFVFALKPDEGYEFQTAPTITIMSDTSELIKTGDLYSGVVKAYSSIMISGTVTPSN